MELFSETLAGIMGFAVSCAFPLGMIALFAVIAYISRQRMVRGWTDFANRTGMAMSSSSIFTRPTITGAFQGRPARLWTYTVRHGKSSTTYTAMSVATKNPSGYSLMIRPSSVFDGLGRAITGKQEVQIGDESFDKRFDIKSTPESLATGLLGMDSSLREALQRIPSLHLELQGDQVTYRHTGLETNPDKLYTLAELMDRFAGRLEEQVGLKSGFGALPAEEKSASEEDVWGEKEETASEEDIWGGKTAFGGEAEYGGKAEYGAGDPHNSWQDDPFYSKKPIPQSADPFGPPPTAQGPNWKLILIGAFVAFDLCVLAGVAAFFFFPQ